MSCWQKGQVQVYLAQTTVFGIAELHCPARCMTIHTTHMLLQRVLQAAFAQSLVIVINFIFAVTLTSHCWQNAL